MNKRTFLSKLCSGLKGLSKEEREERLSFYAEMIDDRMEEGLSEAEAVLSVGAPEEILKEVLPEKPRRGGVKNRKSALGILLLALGSPVWLSLLIAALAVVVSLYAALSAVIVSLWAVNASVLACGLAGLAYAAVSLFGESGLNGLFVLSAALVCLGLGGFLLYGCRYATKGTFFLFKKGLSGIKTSFT